MNTAVNFEKKQVIIAMEENRKNVRDMVMESYHDMQEGKGRDYKEFFSEMESRYNNDNI